MPAEVLLLAKATPTLPKGAIIAVQPAGWIWGAEEGLPNFAQLTIADTTAAQVRQYLQPWRRWVQITVESKVGNTVTLKLSNQDVIRTSDGEGGFPRALVEQRINDWNGTVTEDIDGEVVFTVSSFGIVTSDAFWEKDVSAAVFVDQGVTAGVQRVSCDYSATPWAGKSNAVSQRITTRRGDVITNDGTTVVFEFDQDDIRHHFRDSMRDYEDLVSTRRYYLRSVAVDEIISAGGHMETDKATVIANIRDQAA